ncbi:MULTISPECIES: 3-hydroxyacyl-CoA dehydrogenase family protein [unclassified Paenibacillus]|uniref:3-hydroxyacyl-CoA dehydrogenase family protein n=1 Tax=unclassified Paenibacillus TaxID=185978 RepID=UPI001AE50AD8|nr:MULTISPECIES: 3-hydroxyacyl-CoA dehydrogenase family protein [unclassified Paenibacillus]MBP1156984.1 3-hydroxybutyryl-CoA dehydrogenase [Paenibacillus sp. PvP091]MBP1172277.1 3-hydroxybutyryl-CoA dehydrogenase [Paenibacillus sp. PvR098]MBP2438658.1 3-hydroxybutyryl-CoA dehydrogenase [Paenibacillus sp. PvP052]
MTNKQVVSVVGTNLLADALRKQLSSMKGVEVLDFQEAKTRSIPLHIVIETSNLELAEKKARLQNMEKYIASDTLILSSVLGVTATQAASWLSHPSRLVGFAAFANLEQTELIELCAALQTDAGYAKQAEAFITAIGKETEWVEDEVGLVFPRILSMIVNEAAFALMEKISSAEEIDTAMRKGTNYPMGPLAWADEVGLDDIYAVLSGLHRDLGEDRYRPAPILRKLVHAGWLGQKTGRGFYTYANQDAKETFV